MVPAPALATLRSNLIDANLQAFLVAVITSLPAVITAVAGAWVVLARIRDIHTIVNSQRAEMAARIEELQRQLTQRQASDEAQAYYTPSARPTVPPPLPPRLTPPTTGVTAPKPQPPRSTNPWEET